MLWTAVAGTCAVQSPRARGLSSPQDPKFRRPRSASPAKIPCGFVPRGSRAGLARSGCGEGTAAPDRHRGWWWSGLRLGVGQAAAGADLGRGVGVGARVFRAAPGRGDCGLLLVGRIWAGAPGFVQRRLGLVLRWARSGASGGRASWRSVASVGVLERCWCRS